MLALSIGLALAVGLVLGLTLWKVEDWSRDLSVNTADTVADHPNPDQRPLIVDGSLEETAELVRRAASSLPRWSPGPEEILSNRATLKWVRTTPLMRYRDDVTVTIETVSAGSRITVHSESRVGKGDLGQNPRNIRELIQAIRGEQDP